MIFCPNCGVSLTETDITAQRCTNCNEELEERQRVPCSRCGKPTTRDPIYDDLCYRCCRAENE